MTHKTKPVLPDIDEARSLRKAVLIDATAGGVVTFHHRDQPAMAGALPIFSVDSEDQARALQVVLCKRGYRSEYILNPEIRDAAESSGSVEPFIGAFERAYLAMKRREAGEQKGIS